MPLDLNSEQLAELNTKMEVWLTEAREAHSQKYEDWNKYDAYFANQQAPSGFTQDHAAKVIEANDPNTATMNAKQYVVVNKVRQTHEQVLGDFITGKKTITASGRSPRDKKFAQVIKKEFQYVTDKAMLWDRVMIPAIDYCIRRGIHFVKVTHNPFVDLPNGRIEIEARSCRDVMIDPNSRGQFYEDKRFIIERHRFTVDKANKKFKDYLEEGKEFGPDNQYDEPYSQTPDTAEIYCTIYEVQWHDIVWKYMMQTDPNDQDSLEEITEQEFRAVSNDPRFSRYAFKQETEVHYVTWYNPGLKVFHHQENEFGCYTLIEVLNIRDENTAYPIADSEYYINLQDLFNILLSVILEHSKQNNSPFVSMEGDKYVQFKDIIEANMKSRGPRVIPDAQAKIWYPNQLNELVVQLVQMVDGYISDMQSRHPASMGEMPSKSVAKETVNLLVAQDRQAHGRKDSTIRYAMTNMARVITKMIFKKFTEEHWAKLTDSKKGDTDYTPVNVMASQEEYNQLLLSMMGVDSEVPRNDQENAALLQSLEQFRQKFESENEVKRKVANVWFVPDGKGGGLQYSDRQLVQAAQDLGISIDEFKYLYNPQQTQELIYVINDISDDLDIDLIYDIDFDFERDRQVRQNQAMYAAGQGWIVPKRALEIIEFPDADQASEEADKRNEMLQLGAQIASNPQAMALIRQLFAQQQGQTQEITQ